MLSGKILPVSIIVGLLLVSCVRQESAPAPASESTLTPSVIVADELFARKCATCHGGRRQGMYDLGGSLIPQSLAERSDSVLKQTISGGIPYTAMPSFKNTLSPEEIDALVQFIKYTSP